MLYVTTRNITDAHTSYRTLLQDRDTDGGLYVPFRIPKYSPQQIDGLKERSFSQCVAELLRLMFGAKIDSWDVDFCIGRHPFRLVPLTHKIVVGETWRNPDWNFSRLVRNLSGRLQNVKEQSEIITSWSWIAVRMAVVVGLFAELEKLGLTDSKRYMDVAVDTSDLSAAVTLLYCKRLGLPIGNIICSCTEEDAVWELFHGGRVLFSEETVTVPENTERLIYEVLGFEQAQRYIQAVKNREDYVLAEPDRVKLCNALHMMPISSKRVGSIIPSVYNTSTYVLSPRSALAYGGLLDHRSRGGERKASLLLTEISPVCDAQAVAEAMSISVAELTARVHNH